MWVIKISLMYLIDNIVQPAWLHGLAATASTVFSENTVAEQQTSTIERQSLQQLFPAALTAYDDWSPSGFHCSSPCENPTTESPVLAKVFVISKLRDITKKNPSNFSFSLAKGGFVRYPGLYFVFSAPCCFCLLINAFTNKCFFVE